MATCVRGEGTIPNPPGESANQKPRTTRARGCSRFPKWRRARAEDGRDESGGRGIRRLDLVLENE
uniref:Uncharacterized protein n=1 Tax=Arundo donax TaxID=35708 RepID=A0A0A9ABZ9_ARUDO